MTAGQTEQTRVHTILYVHIHAHAQHVIILSEVCIGDRSIASSKVSSPQIVI